MKRKSWTTDWWMLWRRAYGSVLKLVGALLLVGGAGLLAYQVFNWWEDGQWVDRPTLALVRTLPSDFFFREWIERPASWHGLHRAVIWVLDLPIAFVTMLVGLGVWLAGSSTEPGRYRTEKP